MDMNKYECRRLQLIKLRDDQCDGKASLLAEKIGRAPSYVSRMLYPEGKRGKKRIADDMIEVIENAFSLPKGWLDGLGDSPEHERFVQELSVEISQRDIPEHVQEAIFTLITSSPKKKSN